MGWLLWALAWAQSAASIVYTYVRLEQRGRAVEEASGAPRSRRSLVLATGNLVVVAGLALLDVVSPWIAAAYLPQWVEVLWGLSHPASGQKPRAIGMRQLAISTLYTALFLLGVRS
jgi:hypothetical protein